MESRILACRKNDSALRIGVAGHRMNRLSAENARELEAPIRAVISDLQHDSREKFADPRIVTSLAEGADRIVAREAVARHMLETVVLPFPRQRFEQDFSSEASRLEFRELLKAAELVIEPPSGAAIDSGDGYQQASAIVIACADVLIAVWDGEPGRGPGGTAHTIDTALVREIPVIWIRSSAPYSVQVIEPEAGLAGSPLAQAIERIRSRPCIDTEVDAYDAPSIRFIET